MTFQDILARYRAVSFSERDKGDRFERLMQAFLQTVPWYAGTFRHVWLWREFPYKQNLGGKDTGIDLVAQTVEGDFWAIQCKCYDEKARIDKPAVDSFLATSSKQFINDEHQTTSFALRLWIATTNNWGGEAENAIRHQEPPVQRISLADLENAPVDWAALEQGVSLNWIMDGLKQRGAVATFLMVGERVSEVSDVLPRMVNEGHELGNHTMNHPMCHLTGLGVDDIRTQIDDATNAVKDIAGQAPQVLRPVGGGVNSDVKAVAAELGYPIINWSVDTEDWKYRDADHVKKAIVEQAQDGDVVLMHDLYETSVRGALAAIDELQSRTDKTYAFVTVSQLAAIHGITLEPGVVYNALSDEVAQQIADGSYSPTEFT